MNIRPTSAPLALSAAFGCTLNLGPVSDSTTNVQTSDPGGGTTTATPETSGTTGEPTPTTGPMTTGVGPITTGQETGTSGTDTGDHTWCNGFDPQLAGLAVHNNADVPIMDGSKLAAECGGQGIIMIPIFPHFGGFTPTGDTVMFDVLLDVEGFNLGPGGHFFQSVGHDQDVDCSYEDTYGGYYSYAFIPIFPPDGVADINLIDGKAGHLELTMHTPDGDVPFAADVVLEAKIDACGYGGYESYGNSTGSTDGDSTG